MAPQHHFPGCGHAPPCQGHPWLYNPVASIGTAKVGDTLKSLKHLYVHACTATSWRSLLQSVQSYEAPVLQFKHAACTQSYEAWCLLQLWPLYRQSAKMGHWADLSFQSPSHMPGTNYCTMPWIPTLQVLWNMARIDVGTDSANMTAKNVTFRNSAKLNTGGLSCSRLESNVAYFHLAVLLEDIQEPPAHAEWAMLLLSHLSQNLDASPETCALTRTNAPHRMAVLDLPVICLPAAPGSPQCIQHCSCKTQDSHQWKAWWPSSLENYPLARISTQLQCDEVLPSWHLVWSSCKRCQWPTRILATSPLQLGELSLTVGFQQASQQPHHANKLRLCFVCFLL